MFTKRRDWRRWSGPRTEVTAAVNLASTVLEQWSGIPSAVRFRISYANQLTETSDDPTALEQLHRTDLRRIEDVWIDVETDLDWWKRRMDEHITHASELRLQGKTDEAAALVAPPPLMSSSVSFRLGDWISAGMRVDVMGPDRTNVEGLTTRLAEVLNRSASGPTSLPTGMGLWILIPGVAIGGLIGVLVVRAFHLAPVDNRWQWQEIVVPIAAAIATGGFFTAFDWALPSLEILDAGERSRFERFRGLLLSGLGAIIAGLIVTAIWAAVT